MIPTPREDEHEASRGRVTDRRGTPTGVLPRQLQTWLMVGIAVVIVLIILITGHREPPMPTASTVAQAPVTVAPADRIRLYQQQLAAEEERQRQALANGRTTMTSDRPSPVGPAAASASVAPNGPQQAAESLRADNVAFSRRTPSVSTPSQRIPGRDMASVSGVSPSPALDTLEALARTLAQRSTPSASREAAPPSPAAGAPEPIPHDGDTLRSEQSGEQTASPATEHPAPGPRFTLFEGTVIETALLNRIDGTFAGPVVCQVTTPVYAQDRQRVLIPQGARVLGSASAVQAWGDARLAVGFHRLLMPDGHTYSLDRFKGLDQVGETGVRDSVDRHYVQVFGASLAIGALSGLAQYNTRTGFAGTGFDDQFRQSAGASVANSATRILDRYLNVLPTLTIREGHRIKVYLTNDFELPAYVSGAPGGVR